MKNKYLLSTQTLLIISLFLPTTSFATSGPNLSHKWSNEFILNKMCNIRERVHQKFPRIPVPKICQTKEIKPPILEFYADKNILILGESTSLHWVSQNTIFCEASGGWTGERLLSGDEIIQPSETTSYILTCDGVNDGVEKSLLIEVTKPEPEPEVDVCPNIPDIQESIPAGYHDENGECVPDEITPPPPTINNIIISEVYYDVDSTHGVEPSNEWIEIYNGTGGPIDVSGWGVYDSGASGFDSIPAGTIIPNDSFLLITGSSTTATNWTGKNFVVLPTIIGNGLANGGDAVFLKDLSSTTIDSMSYGSNTSVFSLPLPSPSDGHSFRRKNLTSDTDSSDDWEDLSVPTPGEF